MLVRTGRPQSHANAENEVDCRGTRAFRVRRHFRRKPCLMHGRQQGHHTGCKLSFWKPYQHLLVQNIWQVHQLSVQFLGGGKNHLRPKWRQGRRENRFKGSNGRNVASSQPRQKYRWGRHLCQGRLLLQRPRQVQLTASRSNGGLESRSLADRVKPVEDVRRRGAAPKQGQVRSIAAHDMLDTRKPGSRRNQDWKSRGPKVGGPGRTSGSQA